MHVDLILGGSGARGLALVGAVGEFERRGHTSRCLVGSSTGALVAVLLAAGYDADGIYRVLKEQADGGKPAFATFAVPPAMAEFSQAGLDNTVVFQVLGEFGKWLARMNSRGLKSLGLTISALSNKAGKRLLKLVLKNVDGPTRDDVLSIYSIVERGGLFSARPFERWLVSALVDQDPRFADADLATFHRLTGRDLSLVATDVNGRQTLVLNHRTAPGVPVMHAVRMSMTLPFIWTPVLWRPDWGAYLGKDIAGHRLIDGGMGSDLIRCLTVSSSEMARIVMGDVVIGDNGASAVPTMALMLDDTLRVPRAGRAPAPAGVLQRLQEIRDGTTGVGDQTHLFSFIADLAGTLTADRDFIAAAPLVALLCRLPASGYSALEFDMTPKRRKALVAAATQAMSDLLDQREASGTL